MKRNLVKRVFAAAALATLAAAVSACGSSNNSAVAGVPCAPGVYCSGGVAGAAVTNTGTGCVISFSGNGGIDGTGGISGSFGVSGEQTGMVTTPGGYMAGYINQVDGSLLEINMSSSGAGYMAIQGVLSLGSDEAPGGCTMQVSEVTLNSIGLDSMPTGQPFGITLQGGGMGSCENGFGAVLLNGSTCVPTW